MVKSILRFLNKFGLFLRFYNDSSMLYIHYIYYNVDGKRVKEYYSHHPDNSGLQVWFKFTKTGFWWKATVPVGNPLDPSIATWTSHREGQDTEALIKELIQAANIGKR